MIVRRSYVYSVPLIDESIVKSWSIDDIYQPIPGNPRFLPQTPHDAIPAPRMMNKDTWRAPSSRISEEEKQDIRDVQSVFLVASETM
jgi:hypothetical protein